MDMAREVGCKAGVGGDCIANAEVNEAIAMASAGTALTQLVRYVDSNCLPFDTEGSQGCPWKYHVGGLLPLAGVEVARLRDNRLREWFGVVLAR